MPLDTLLNLASFVICGILGIAFNLLIAHYYSEEALGVFNQGYALYLLASQLAVFGTHLSVLHYSSRYSSVTRANQFLSSAICWSVLASCIVTCFFQFITPLIAWVLGSLDTAIGFSLASIGLVFFALNKILLAHVNARRCLKAYAIFQVLRFSLIGVCLMYLIHLDAAVRYLLCILPTAEMILFPILVVFCKFKLRYTFLVPSVVVRLLSLRFARRSMLGNALLDLNSRLDILVVGIFLNDRMVGIYSFAATLAEAFNQFAAVLRVVINPQVARLFQTQGQKEALAFIREAVCKSYYLLVPLGLVAMFVYPVLLYFLGPSDLQEGQLIYVILLLGMLIVSGYLPIQTAFNQLGKPGLQTKYLTIFVGTNLILNVILIQPFGLYGAAIATALAFASQAPLINLLFYRHFGAPIWPTATRS